MKRPLHIEVSDLARAQIRAAQDWWRVNRPKAPNAIREELERASLLIFVQPEIGGCARNISSRAFVVFTSRAFATTSSTGWSQTRNASKSSRFGMRVAVTVRRSELRFCGNGAGVTQV